MKELSIKEMTSVRGGFGDLGQIISAGNLGAAIPINATINSGNAFFGSVAGNGGTLQNATNSVGNINALQVVI
jgi:hypothetical protein